MTPGSIVIVNLRHPLERLMGRLIEINPSGVTIRGLDLGAFEDWMRDIAGGEERGIGPTSLFLPMHRIEKVMLDEDLGSVPSLANTFLRTVGVPIHDHLE